MMGPDITGSNRGVIPRISEQIFQGIHESPMDIEFTVKVSYMEIYMEKIRDLLCPLNDNLQIHEDKNQGVYVKDLVTVYVSSINEVFDIMSSGQLNLAKAATEMNSESSRSHSIFVMTINQRNVDGSNKTGRLYLVDLAGSEKIRKTKASGQTLEEAKKINRSLTCLGMVINALTDGKSTHVPYRDSKLTRILQESLGGNSQTTLIINCSPSSYNDAETLSTLRFGTRAKFIKNKAKINLELSPMELRNLLRISNATALEYKSYNAALESELVAWRSGATVLPQHQVTFDNFGSLETIMEDEFELKDNLDEKPESIDEKKKSDQVLRLEQAVLELQLENSRLQRSVDFKKGQEKIQILEQNIEQLAILHTQLLHKINLTRLIKPIRGNNKCQ